MNGSCVFKTNNAKKRQKLAKYVFFRRNFTPSYHKNITPPPSPFGFIRPWGGGGKNKMFYVFFD